MLRSEEQLKKSELKSVDQIEKENDDRRCSLCGDERKNSAFMVENKDFCICSNCIGTMARNAFEKFPAWSKQVLFKKKVNGFTHHMMADLVTGKMMWGMIPETIKEGKPDEKKDNKQGRATKKNTGQKKQK